MKIDIQPLIEDFTLLTLNGDFQTAVKEARSCEGFYTKLDDLVSRISTRCKLQKGRHKRNFKKLLHHYLEKNEILSAIDLENSYAAPYISLSVQEATTVTAEIRIPYDSTMADVEEMFHRELKGIWKQIKEQQKKVKHTRTDASAYLEEMVIVWKKRYLDKLSPKEIIEFIEQDMTTSNRVYPGEARAYEQLPAYLKKINDRIKSSFS